MTLIISENGRRFIIHDTVFSIEKYSWTFGLIEIEKDGKIRNYKRIQLTQDNYGLMLEELKKGVLHNNLKSILKSREVF